MKSSFGLICFFALLVGTGVCQSPAAPGKAGFDAICAMCHGDNGRGGDKGPNIAAHLNELSDDQLSTLLHDGIPDKGMPGFPSLAGEEKTQLLAYLRNTIRTPTRGPGLGSRTVELVDGRKLTGIQLNESSLDLQIKTDDNLVHLLRPAGDKFREVTSQVDWPSYDGSTAGDRFSPLKQITLQNVSRVAPKWIFSLAGAGRGETTPIVVQGIMYATSGDQMWALDPGTGRQIWHFQKPSAGGRGAGAGGGGAPEAGGGGGGLNRGAAVDGDNAFMVTSNAHMIALNRFTGKLVWDTEMAQNGASGAPLVANHLVIGGVTGGDSGARGFLAAYDCKTGKEVWRFWSVPAAGEPGSETWGTAKALEHPGGATWLTGSFDPKLNLIYWGIGNPGPDYDGSQRPGDNLYTSSIVALDAATGKLRWYYQTTPHDVHDWDATEPLALVDRDWQGSPRKLLIQANRNGFFYVLDRETGKLLLGRPYAKQMNWSKELDAQGKPVLLPLPAGPNPGSIRVCPAQAGATNWFASTYDPATGYYILQRFDICSIITPQPGVEFGAGRGYNGGTQHLVEDQVPHETLIAIDVTTGKTVWELPETGSLSSWGGTLGLASGILFFCGDAGVLTAVDMKTGKPSWQFETSTEIHSSPMTYVFDGKQYVALNVGSNILAFGLTE